MPLPSAHLKQSFDLSRSLARLSRLMQDSDLDEILDRLHDAPADRAAAEQDPVAFLRKHGLRVPSGVSVAITDNNWNVTACTSTRTKVCIIYDSTKGWDLRIT